MCRPRGVLHFPFISRMAYSQLSDPRQSRGHIPVSPSKGPLKSALKGAWRTADHTVGDSVCIVSKRRLSLRHSGERRNPVLLKRAWTPVPAPYHDTGSAGVTVWTGATIALPLSRELVLLNVSQGSTAAFGQTFGSHPHKAGGLPFRGYMAVAEGLFRLGLVGAPLHSQERDAYPSSFRGPPSPPMV